MRRRRELTDDERAVRYFLRCLAFFLACVAIVGVLYGVGLYH